MKKIFFERLIHCPQILEAASVGSTQRQEPRTQCSSPMRVAQNQGSESLPIASKQPLSRKLKGMQARTQALHQLETGIPNHTLTALPNTCPLELYKETKYDSDSLPRAGWMLEAWNSNHVSH